MKHILTFKNLEEITNNLEMLESLEVIEDFECQLKRCAIEHGYDTFYDRFQDHIETHLTNVHGLDLEDVKLDIGYIEKSKTDARISIGVNLVGCAGYDAFYDGDKIKNGAQVSMEVCQYLLDFYYTYEIGSFSDYYDLMEGFEWITWYIVDGRLEYYTDFELVSDDIKKAFEDHE